MKPEIRKFFENKNLPPSEIIKRGKRKNLTDEQIYQGMEKVYNRVKGGEVIKPISIVWAVWSEAAHCGKDPHAAVEGNIAKLKKKLSSHERANRTLMAYYRDEKTKFERLEIYVFFLVITMCTYFAIMGV